MTIRPITSARFEALCFFRNPELKLYAEEREWYSDETENVLGVVLFDKIDFDWNFVILGRDEMERFCAIDQDINFPSADDARKAVHEKMLSHSAAGTRTFPQGRDVRNKRAFRLFAPIVPPDKRNPLFITLSETGAFSPAKEIITEIAYTFDDPDGNYIKDFQSDGFDARLWELYLYAALHESDFLVNRDFHAPDYICDKFGFPVVIEATTVNPTKLRGQIEVIQEDPDSEEIANYIAIKFANALFYKLQKRYWDLAHVHGKPLVLAVADFKKPEGIHYSAKYLQEYLYAQRQTKEGNIFINTPIKHHVYRDRKKPSGFFYLPDSENISAVLFSDGGTISKFNRMGKIAGFGSQNVMMLRIGQRYETCRSADVTEFRLAVSPPQYTETWSEGIYIFHNPNAKTPLDSRLFPDASHTFFTNGHFRISVPDRFPVWSKTIILHPDETISSIETPRPQVN